MQTNNSPVYLYILMRTDLASMNAGKAVAQGAHAANQFQTLITRIYAQLTSTVMLSVENTNVLKATNPFGLGDGLYSNSKLEEIMNLYHLWLEQGCEHDGFGTTITLGATGEQLTTSIAAAQGAGMMSGVTHDPTYPLRDGSFTHLIPLDTCGFVFGHQDDAQSVVGHLHLMGYCGASDHAQSDR